MEKEKSKPKDFNKLDDFSSDNFFFENQLKIIDYNWLYWDFVACK